MMDKILPLHMDEDHVEALRRLEALWDAPVGTSEFEVLGTPVDAYERQRYPVGDPPRLGALSAGPEIGIDRRIAGVSRGEDCEVE